MTAFATVDNVAMAFEACPECGIFHGFERELHQVANRRSDKLSICCPNGHWWYYTKNNLTEGTKEEPKKAELLVFTGGKKKSDEGEKDV